MITRPEPIGGRKNMCQWKKISWPYLIVSISVLVVGRWGSVPQDQVYGRYVDTYPFGTETLVLNRDGSYEQQFAIEAQP